jgi:hypothetical protein
MSEDDVLFGYRLRVFDYAARTSVSEACRVFGIHRSTSLCLEAAGGAAWAGDPAAQGAPAAADAAAAVAVCRRAHRRLRARPPRLWTAPGRERAASQALGRGSSSATTASGAACAGMVSTPAPSGSHSLPAGGDRTCMLIALTNPAGSLPPVHGWLSKRSGRRRAVVRAAWAGRACTRRRTAVRELAFGASAPCSRVARYGEGSPASAPRRA